MEEQDRFSGFLRSLYIPIHVERKAHSEKYPLGMLGVYVHIIHCMEIIINNLIYKLPNTMWAYLFTYVQILAFMYI